MNRIISNTRVPIKIWADDLEPEAEQQVRNVSELPFLHKHVAVMPDAHAGKGSTIGTVIATKGAIIPSTLGVDLGCGMSAVRLPFKIDRLEKLDRLRSSIERSVPLGFNENKNPSDEALLSMKKLGEVSETTAGRIRMDKAARQIGSLGGGNHFIEICQDQEQQAWVMLHSGSRNAGKSLAEIHIDVAKGLMKKAFISVPDPDLAYLWQGSREFDNYIHDMNWAQNYASLNRDHMMASVLKDISYHLFGENIGRDKMQTFCVSCHHNYCQMENHMGSNVWVTRKGAVSAKAGEYGIIPGSMGAKSYIVQGLGNPESFNSCSHGAGRKMSRTQARKIFTADDLVRQTQGVECRKDDGVVDEIPQAYKDIDVVMKNQEDLVRPVFELKQVLCIKG